MPRKGQRNRRAQVTEPRNIQAREREAEALELRKAGATYRQIGARLRISAQAAHKRVTEALRGIAETTGEKAEEVRSLEMHRLDTMLLGLWSKARTGDVAAIDRVVKIMQRRADMLGIDAASKHEVTGKDGRSIRIEDARTELAGTLARLTAAITPARDPGKPQQ